MWFSVVIPLYNKRYSIMRCVSSVLNQSYKNYEVIIVDDGSTDKSLDILRNTYKEEIASDLIRIIQQPNQGVSVARNNGIKLSKSNYICFLDADDEWRSDFLYKMKVLIEDYPNADLYALAHNLKKEKRELVRPKHGLPDNYRGYVKDFFKASTKGSVANSSKVCVKKQSLLSFGGFPEGVVAGEDLYVWIMLALKGRVACEMSYSCIVYRETDSSRSARKNSVPYPFIFFSKKPRIRRSRSLNKYLFYIFYRHFLSSILNFKFKEAGLRLYYFFKTFV